MPATHANPPLCPPSAHDDVFVIALQAIRRACANLNGRPCHCATLSETCAAARVLASIPAACASDNLPRVP